MQVTETTVVFLTDHEVQSLLVDHIRKTAPNFIPEAILLCDETGENPIHLESGSCQYRVVGSLSAVNPTDPWLLKKLTQIS